jgi:multiple sugar transport system substrate-binding protein
MKKKKKSLSLMLIILLAFTLILTGCGNNGTDVELDDEGNIRPGSDVTTITFWGYGDDVELSVFTKLKNEFNELYKDSINVKYVQKSSDGYATNVRITLGGSKGPDVFYVADSDYKALAEYEYLYSLSDYLNISKDVVVEDMWDSSINRYLYDVNTTTSTGPNAKYWGVPKDIGPTVIYYNETFFQNAGITVLSVAAENLEAFNNGGTDDRGKTKEALGIIGEVKEKGYFVLNGKKYFNNQISMSWEESVACANVVQDGSNAEYGLFTEWWFNYGWSVGGDCTEYIPTEDSAYNGGYWDFTLMDNAPNYIVADNAESFTVNGNIYEAGEIISYQDKLINFTATNKSIKSEIISAQLSGQLNQLPSQREAFVEFVRLGQKSNVLVDDSDGVNLYGYGITPSPTSIGGDSGKTIAFANGNVAMLVDGRWNVPNFRSKMDGKYKWDVAPLPMYKQYDSEGNITVHGVEAGHSGSVALCINAKTKYANASWKFVEYIAGAKGQTEQAKSGFAIPSQKAIANTEDFLQSNQNPKNSKIFLNAAEIQNPGDWWYLRDKAWIDPWAGILNGDVRNGKMTLSDFEKSSEYTNTFNLLKIYTKK